VGRWAGVRAEAVLATDDSPDAWCTAAQSRSDHRDGISTAAGIERIFGSVASDAPGTKPPVLILPKSREAARAPQRARAPRGRDRRHAARLRTRPTSPPNRNAEVDDAAVAPRLSSTRPGSATRELRSRGALTAPSWHLHRLVRADRVEPEARPQACRIACERGAEQRAQPRSTGTESHAGAWGPRPVSAGLRERRRSPRRRPRRARPFLPARGCASGSPRQRLDARLRPHGVLREIEARGLPSTWSR
jgi:hypothetical protein